MRSVVWTSSPSRRKEIMYEIINELRENAVALAEHKKREDALRERIAVLLAKPKLSVPPQARK